jgi:hypothetical protein
MEERILKGKGLLKQVGMDSSFALARFQTCSANANVRSFARIASLCASISRIVHKAAGASGT